VIEQPAEHGLAGTALALGAGRGPGQSLGHRFGNSLADGVAPCQFGLGGGIAALGHAAQLVQGQPPPEFVGMAEQGQALGCAATDQAAVEHLPEQAEQHGLTQGNYIRGGFWHWESGFGNSCSEYRSRAAKLFTKTVEKSVSLSCKSRGDADPACA